MSFSARQLTSYSCMRPAAEAGCVMRGSLNWSLLVWRCSVPLPGCARCPVPPSQLARARAVGRRNREPARAWPERLPPLRPRGGVSRDG